MCYLHVHLELESGFHEDHVMCLVGFCFIVYTGTPDGCLLFYIIKRLPWRGSCDLEVCGLHGDHVTGVISLRGESIAGWGFIFVHRHS